MVISIEVTITVKRVKNVQGVFLPLLSCHHTFSLETTRTSSLSIKPKVCLSSDMLYPKENILF